MKKRKEIKNKYSKIVIIVMLISIIFFIILGVFLWKTKMLM